MLHQLKYHYPLIYDSVHYWPVAVFLPGLLLLVAVLVLVTRWWDRHDARVTRARRVTVRRSSPRPRPSR